LRRLLIAICLATLAVPAATASSQALPRVTLIGDSVAGALNLEPRARAYLGRGIDLRVDAKVCRRLAETSCPYRGVRPPTALETIQDAGAALGSVVIIDLGYNDGPADYAAGIDPVMRALGGAGVEVVVWVTLGEEVNPALYRKTNTMIDQAARRWESIVVADWEKRSRGRRWFAEDGLHLNAVGTMGLARLLRPLVVAAACGGTCSRVGGAR